MILTFNRGQKSYSSTIEPSYLMRKVYGFTDEYHRELKKAGKSDDEICLVFCGELKKIQHGSYARLLNNVFVPSKDRPEARLLLGISDCHDFLRKQRKIEDRLNDLVSRAKDRAIDYACLRKRLKLAGYWKCEQTEFFLDFGFSFVVAQDGEHSNHFEMRTLFTSHTCGAYYRGKVEDAVRADNPKVSQHLLTLFAHYRLRKFVRTTPHPEDNTHRCFDKKPLNTCQVDGCSCDSIVFRPEVPKLIELLNNVQQFQKAQKELGQLIATPSP